jgi:hypothetical protein
MEDQIKYEQKRYENLRNAILKEEHDESLLFKPKISENSKRIVEKKGDVSDVTRSKNFIESRKKEYLDKLKEEEQGGFKPAINKSSKKLKRNEKDLYMDAERRVHQKKLV